MKKLLLGIGSFAAAAAPVAAVVACGDDDNAGSAKVIITADPSGDAAYKFAAVTISAFPTKTADADKFVTGIATDMVGQLDTTITKVNVSLVTTDATPVITQVGDITISLADDAAKAQSITDIKTAILAKVAADHASA